MAVVRVHAQLALVVGAPEPEGDEPGVQQTGVVGVLDVLLHQLPVAGNALAVVAQDRELAAVEQAVEVLQDGRPHVLFERLDLVIERGEHHAAAHRHLELRQRMVLGVEVGRHAAIDLAVLPHAAAKGHTLQVAVGRVAPLVVGADELGLVAVALAAETHAAVRADVLHHMDRAVGGAGHDDRTFADHAALEVARVGDFRFQADVTPVALVEEALQFALVALLIGVDGEGDAAGAAQLPVQGIRAGDGGLGGHGVSPVFCRIHPHDRQSLPIQQSKRRDSLYSPSK
ncbi:hypothetical protein Y695_03916 [Hydrogenophaga sp. T4]|nr:hypothetical protein Y695_03916 [Hydrogenophaga sp. T4]